MQDQEKSFLAGFLYLVTLGIFFVVGVLYQFYFKPIPVTPEVVEVTKIVEVPKIIETTRVVEQFCEVEEVEPKKGWFK